MNEREFAAKIKENLNYGLGRIDTKLALGLEAARKQALEAFEPAHEHAMQWAGVHHGHGHGKHHPFRWLSLAILITALGGAIYWQQSMDDDDIDAALLGDDLPVNAYLDHGFHEWLDRSSQR